jgi:catechol 2,3-dioxygenase-like lactoylglutathione lyase family enzyme
MKITALDHVQIAMPSGGEPLARDFYGRLLGLNEVQKPPQLSGRGGCWFGSPGVTLHLGVESEFRPARKAHPALRVQGYGELLERLSAAGVAVVRNEELPGVERSFVSDPFGNRIELIED